MALHRMPMYWGDYLRDTLHFSTTQHGAYLLLIAYYWCNGGLPEDENAIRKIAKCTPLAWRKIGPAVLEKFVITRDKNRCIARHKRIDIELRQAIDKSSVNSANAQRKNPTTTTTIKDSDSNLPPSAASKNGSGVADLVDDAGHILVPANEIAALQAECPNVAVRRVIGGLYRSDLVAGLSNKQKKERVFTKIRKDSMKKASNGNGRYVPRRGTKDAELQAARNWTPLKDW